MSEKQNDEKNGTATNQEESASTVSSTNAFAQAVLNAVRDRGTDAPSRWSGTDAKETYSQYLSGLLPYRVVTIAAIIGVAVVYYVLPTNWPLPWVLQLAVALVALLVIDRLFTMRSDRASADLVKVVTQDCDTKKYREILDMLGHRDALRLSRNILAVEYARCDYLDGKDESALNRLDAIKGKHLPRNLRLLILNLRANAYAALGRSKECGDTLVELEVLGSSLSNHGHRKSVDDLIENMGIQLKETGKMTGDDAGVILEKLEQEPTHAGRVSFQLTLARYLISNGQGDAARTLLEDKALTPMVPASERTRDKLLAELRGEKTTH